MREDLEEMRSGDVLRTAMRERNVRQTDLGARLGMQQASVSGNLNRTRMGLDVFIKMLDAMGYDVVVADRKTNEAVWKVTN